MPRMDKLTAEWCLREARFCRKTALAFRGADKRAGFGDGYKCTAAALTIAARVLDEGAVEGVARVIEGEYYAIATEAMKGGAIGFARDDEAHQRIARAVLARLKGEQ